MRKAIHIYIMQFKQWLEHEYYHGSPIDFDKLDYTYIGQGHDQEGPGFYFTSDNTEARRYATSAGRVYKSKIELNKTVPLKGRPNKRDIVWLVKNAPELESILLNWDENPTIALGTAIDSILTYSKNPHDAFQQVWYDFYHITGNDAQYLKNMVKLGYDGVIIPQSNGEKHAIVFSPDKVTLT